MAVLDPNEIFFTAFEPKVKNRFIMYVDGIPSYFIKGIDGLTYSSEEITLNHINVMRKVKGRSKWEDVTMTLYDPITPSGAQAVMEWVRLHHESVTGRWL
jgi:alpha-amylase/alpha-mannosidase (GH57 family)